MTAEPRTKWQYQKIMYIAVSHAIEQLTGQPLGEFLRKQIWEPLGMESTFFTHGDAAEYVKQSKDADVSLATPYLWVPSDRSNTTPLATGSEGDHFDQIPYDLPPYVRVPYSL
jgi:CubicO group peptidase (beta-lactamase class C family)